MKIAIIATAYPYRGGIAAFSERLAKQLVDEDHEVTIYTFTVQYPNFLFPGKSQFSTEASPKGINIIRCINSMNPVNWLKVGNRIKKENFDLVIPNFWLPLMGPSFGTILRRVRSNRRTKVISIIHNMIPHEKRIGDSIFSKYFLSPVQSFVALSKTVLEDISEFDKLKPRILTAHPVYDNFGDIEDRDTALRKLGWSIDDKYLLFFGLIRDYKGLDLLLEAFTDIRLRNKGLKLIIAGEYYTDKEVYLEIIKKHGLDEMIYQIDKFIPDSEVANYFNAADLVVQPYKSATQSGVTQIAYHFNKPMIVTDVGGLKDMCPDGKVGFVVKPNPTEISKAIIRFFEEADIDRMKEYIEAEKKKLSWNVLTSKLIEQFKAL